MDQNNPSLRCGVGARIKTRSGPLLEAEYTAALTKIEEALQSDLQPTNNTPERLRETVETIKIAYETFNVITSEYIHSHLNHGSTNEAISLKVKRSSIKKEVSDCLAIINAGLADEDKFSDLASVCSTSHADAGPHSSADIPEEGTNRPLVSQSPPTESIPPSHHDLPDVGPLSATARPFVASASRAGLAEDDETFPSTQVENTAKPGKSHVHFHSPFSDHNVFNVQTNRELYHKNNSMTCNNRLREPFETFPSTNPAFSRSNAVSDQSGHLGTVGREAGLDQSLQLLEVNTNNYGANHTELYLIKLNLFQKTCDPYRGEPHLFHSFINRVNNAVRDLPLSPNEVIRVLEAQTDGRPLRIIQSQLLLGAQNPAKALYCIEKELIRRFGSGIHIVHSLYSKLDAFPPIKSVYAIDQLDDLVELAMLILVNMPTMAELSEFNHSLGVRRLFDKLPEPFQNKWRSFVNEYYKHNVEHPPFEHFLTFLQDRVTEFSDPAYARRPTKNTRDFRSFKTTQDVQTVGNTTNNAYEQVSHVSDHSKSNICPIHPNLFHRLANCRAFARYSDNEKDNMLKKHKLCPKCLIDHRHVKCSASPTCHKCGKGHLTVMHRDNLFNNNKTLGITSPTAPTHEDQITQPQVEKRSLCTKEPRTTYGTCSRTVLVDVYDPAKPEHKIRCYAILDDQSSSSFCDPKLAAFLEKDGPTVEYSLRTLAGAEHKQSGVLLRGLKIRGVDEKKAIKLPDMVTNHAIPENKDEVATPTMVASYPHIKGFAKFFKPVDENAETLLLIGRDCGEAMFTKSYGHKAPYVHRSKLGWSVVGNGCVASSTSLKTTLKTTCYEHVSSQLSFPANEQQEDNMLTANVFQEFPDDDRPALSKENSRFLEKVREKIHVKDGVITLPLPYKHDETVLPENRQHILNRSVNTWKRIQRQPNKLKKCIESMQVTIENGRVEVVPQEEIESKAWYLPVFPVSHPKKDKVRLVFDSSASFHGISLNSCLLSGPDFNNPLRTVLIKFREEPVAFSTDIASMFHCFQLPPEDRDATRFFWFEDNDPTKKLIDYRAKVHLFGNTSSPALAIMGLRYAVSDVQGKTSDKAKQFIEDHFYVDDGLKSVSSTIEAIEIIKETAESLARFGIKLHKIASNAVEVLEAFPSLKQSESSPSLIGTDLTAQQTLGLKWDTVTDRLIIETRVPEKPFTKRGVLATVNSIFDPLKILSPIILTGRLLQRKFIPPKNDDNAEIYALGWDDELPDANKPEWEAWRKSLAASSQISFPRCYRPKGFGRAETTELHVFSDASTLATGHVVYVRYKNTDTSHTALVVANSKIAPRATTTVPRLELCAAMGAATDAAEISAMLEIKQEDVYLYTDSTIVLGYLRNTQKKFSAYVTRRVRIILQRFPVKNWKYVSTENNPADLASRPQDISSLQSSCWFTGPPSLGDDNEHEIPAVRHDDLPETLIERTTLQTQQQTTEVTFDLSSVASRVSKWTTAVGVLRTILRFIRKLRDKAKQKRGYHLAMQEATPAEAEIMLIKHIQQNHFGEAMKTLQKKGQLAPNHPLLRLSPFVAPNGVLRVGGRLRNSELEYAEKFPAVLPHKHPATELLAKYCHQKARHQGRTTSEAFVRQAGYYINKGGRLMKNIIAKCVMCRRLRGAPMTQIMADLPEDRLACTPPFTYSGVDVFGPYYLAAGPATRRNSSTRKCWALLFTCLVSRAVHIEQLPALDITAFRNAFRRFTSIRGSCKMLRADNGTNFVGTANQMTQLDTVKIEAELNKIDTEWRFNPPRAPHFGGVFERKIGSIKNIINACLLQVGKRNLTADEFVTFLAEAAAIVNATPLTPTSSDPDDPLPITPAQLLHLKDNAGSQVNEFFTDADLLAYGSRRWRRVQHLAQQFWQRWRDEYLRTLITRNKWRTTKRSAQPGDVVLLREPNQKRNHWPMAIVKYVKPSKDSHVRTVVVKLAHKNEGKVRELVRPISQIVMLVPKCQGEVQE